MRQLHIMMFLIGSLVQKNVGIMNMSQLILHIVDKGIRMLPMFSI